MMWKKSHPKFNVPNYGAKNRKRVQARWRKQRGIDNKKRIKKAFMGAEPTIGYANPPALRGVRQSGKRAVIVHNVPELKALLSGQSGASLEVTIAGAVSARKRAEIVAAARAGGINVTNANARASQK